MKINITETQYFGRRSIYFRSCRCIMIILTKTQRTTELL